MSMLKTKRTDDSVSSSVPAPKRSADAVEEDDDALPKKKISFGLAKSSTGAVPKKSTGISIKLNSTIKPAAPEPKPSTQVKPKLGLTAAAFNSDDEDDEEEMPPECKMRMKNIGRDTPTSAGPNSFGKSKMGFCDSKKIFEKNLKHYQNR